MKHLPNEYSEHSVDHSDHLRDSQRDSARRNAADASPAAKSISVISAESLERECITVSLRFLFPDSAIRCYDKPEDWEKDKRPRRDGEVVLYNFGDCNFSDGRTKDALRSFIERADPCKVIVLSRCEDLSALFDALDCGAASFLPASVGLEDLIEVMRVSSSRSVVIPRKSMMALRRAVLLRQEQEDKPGLERYFTERQLAVAKALQQGAANKTIAYELNLCESTVKVHIRNIMKKLNATNRTQAAFKLNELSNGNLRLDGSSGS